MRDRKGAGEGRGGDSERAEGEERRTIAPMAPAEQPAKSMRAPGVEPIPFSSTRFVMVAATMRLPRKLYLAARHGGFQG